MMITMARVFISFFFISVYIGCVVSTIGDPTAKLTFTRISTVNVGNDYLDSWSGEIQDGRISLKVPVKKDLPGDMMLKGTAQFNGQKVAEMDISFCDAFNDELFGRTVLEAGIPKDKFPTKCPVQANADYVISKYTYPPSKIPPGIPNGKIIGDFELYKTGEAPYVKIHVEADFSHQFPGMGR